MRQLGVSIIGTDTDVGKTFVTGLLGALAVDDGLDVAWLSLCRLVRFRFLNAERWMKMKYAWDLKVRMLHI